MKKFSTLFCVILLSTLCACSLLLPSSPPIKHIIVVWLKESGNTEHQQRILQASQQLIQIEGVMSVEGGTVISSHRAVVDSSFDIALVITMRDREVLSRYAQHPLHQQLLKDEFKPLIERYRIFDVE